MRGLPAGSLVFVTVRHEISNANGVALTEEHDIVYRDNPLPGAVPPTSESAPTDETFTSSAFIVPKDPKPAIRKLKKKPKKAR